MPKPKKASSLHVLLGDSSQPREHRRNMLRMIFSEPTSASDDMLDAILASVETDKAEAVHAKKIEQLDQMMRELEEGPLRCAIFVSIIPQNGCKTAAPRAQVIFDDGTVAYTVVPDEKLAESLVPGDHVLTDRRGCAILHHAGAPLHLGEEAALERRIGDQLVEVTVRGQERLYLFAAQTLLDKLASGEIAPGASLIVDTRKRAAYDVVPPSDGLSHYKYLVKTPVPDVIVERDIGAPPAVIDEITELLRIEMTQPEVRRKYRLRRCVMQLFTGIPGCGKTLVLYGIQRRMYEVMSEVTGVPINELPSRVCTLRMSNVLSMYYGESDKNLDRFFDEVEKLSDEPLQTPSGEKFYLPVMAVIEEVDGLARQRGSGHDTVYDRVLTTALQRLDSTRPELKKKLILFFGTTNEPEHVDRAFLRRIGASIVKFGRLNRRQFSAVLRKHLADLPIALNGDRSQEEKEHALVSDLTAWLFSPNGSDQGLVELTYTGAPKPDVRCRRDFLTGAVVDLAVQEASKMASSADYGGQEDPGLKLHLLVRAFDEQIRSISDQVTEHNAGKYLDLPDAVRVATVRRLPQPSLFPLELQRN